MPGSFAIYSKHADQYHELISREDYQQNLLPALNSICRFDHLTVVELGAGTGRLTRMLVPVVKFIYAFDRSQHMLDVAEATLQQSGYRNWQLAVGEHRQIAVDNEVADVVLSGWSVCYIVDGNKSAWEGELARTLQEMRRVLRSGGTLILIETLGTGFEQPQPPAGLVGYYAYLEAHGFERMWIRTDYRFQDRAEGHRLANFFFGDEMGTKIRDEEQGAVLPECTGIWWTRKEGGVD